MPARRRATSASPQSVPVWEQFCTWPFFQGAADFRGVIPSPVLELFQPYDNQSCSTLISTDPTALRTAFCQQRIKQAEKRLPRTAGAHRAGTVGSVSAVSSLGSVSAVCAMIARPSRSATTRRQRCVTAGPSGGAQQSGRSPARGCPSAPRGIQSARFPHGNRLCSHSLFWKAAPRGSAPLPSLVPSRRSPR